MLTDKQKHIMRTLFNFFVAAAFVTVILGCSESTRGGAGIFFCKGLLD